MKRFLVNQFGSERGSMFYGMQQARLRKLMAQISGKTDTQRKTLVQTILPKIALYQVLQQFMARDEALALVARYMHEVLCPQTLRQYRALEKIPGFFSLFRRVFTSITLRSDNWNAECVCAQPDIFQINIHQCLWHDACVENGCPELTPVFCRSDELTLGRLHKLSFLRNGTIGLGSELCDFRFQSTR